MATFTPTTQALTAQALYDPNSEAVSNLNKQKAFADALMQRGLTNQPQGQMVDGFYVKPSALQMLNPLAEALTGAYMGNQAEKKQQLLANQLRQQGNEDLTNVMTQLQGRPASQEELAGPAYNNVAPSIQYPAIQPNPQIALQTALQSQAPQVKALIPALIQNTIPKKTDELINYEAAKNDPVNPFKGSFTDYKNQMNEYQKAQLVNEKQRIGLEAQRLNLEKNKLEVNPAEAPLRTSFLNQAQPHIQISQAYRKIVSAPETAAGDMSRIFGYMKILDPGSTVREGEYASAENARGVPSSVLAQYNRVLNGQRLTPQQRNEFTQSAGDLVNSQKQQFNEVAKYYSDISAKNRINPENVIYDPYKDLELKTTPIKTPKVMTSPAQQLNVPQISTGVKFLGFENK